MTHSRAQRLLGWGLSWGPYSLFVAIALGLSWHPQMLVFDGGAGAAKICVWLVWLAFLLYSIRASHQENFFKTVRALNQTWWGRQIGIDLYISVALSLAVVYLHAGSWIVFGLWLIPILLFANLAILLYLAIHFDSLLALLS
jgi:hypothetical protein